MENKYNAGKLEKSRKLVWLKSNPYSTDKATVPYVPVSVNWQFQWTSIKEDRTDTYWYLRGKATHSNKWVLFPTSASEFDKSMTGSSSDEATPFLLSNASFSLLIENRTRTEINDETERNRVIQIPYDQGEAEQLGTTFGYVIKSIHLMENTRRDEDDKLYRELIGIEVEVMRFMSDS